MKRPYNPDRHRRRSLRLKGYDYTQAGAYFVTVVVQERLPLFGVVMDSKMQLNAAGEMVQRVWDEMPNRFPSIEMNAFIAMPNHIHGIIIVGAPLVGARSFNDETSTKVLLGDVVGAFKSLTTVEYVRGFGLRDGHRFTGGCGSGISTSILCEPMSLWKKSISIFSTTRRIGCMTAKILGTIQSYRCRHDLIH